MRVRIRRFLPMTPKGNQTRVDSDITSSRERHTLLLQTATRTLLRRSASTHVLLTAWLYAHASFALRLGETISSLLWSSFPIAPDAERLPNLLWLLLTSARSQKLLPASALPAEAGRPVGQISLDKDANFNCTTAAFTVEALPRTSVCWATSSASSALYAISVRRLTVLNSIFLPTIPHETAVDFV